MVSNLSARSIVALIAIPLFLLAGYAGGWWFILLWLVISVIGVHEFYGMSALRGVSPNRVAGLLFGLFVTLAFAHGRVLDVVSGLLASTGVIVPLPSMGQLFLIIILLFVVLIPVLELFRARPSPIQNIATTLFGVLYVSLLLGSLVGLREIFVAEEFPVTKHFGFQGLSVPDEVKQQIDLWGGMTICTVFAAIWVCDSAAYFAGRAFGKRKLWVRVSPNKTWEGALAGFLAAVTLFLLGRATVVPYLSLSEAVLSGCIIGLFGQFGDLVESLFKRDAGLKDSSSLIPGHGGILDRFDSLLFVSPVLFLYYDFIIMAR